MLPCALTSSPRILLAGVLTAGTFLTSTSALAEPQPASPLAATLPAPAAPPLSAAAALPPQSHPLRPRYPDYLYVPGDWAPSSLPGTPYLPGEPSKRVWYGWQTLLVYGASTVVGLAAGLGGGIGDSDALFVTGFMVSGTGFFLGGPIIHWAHGNTGKGFGALGLNLGVPVAAGGLGVGLACAAGGCGGHGDAGVGIALGLMIGGSVGLITSMIIDVTVLSYETKEPDASSIAKRSPRWTIVPDLTITRQKTTFGFAGVF